MKNMTKPRAQERQLTPGRILHRLYQTQIYEELNDVRPDIKGPSNHKLIKQIISDKELMYPVIQFINGNIDINSAMNEFNLKIMPYMERYKCREKVPEKLFSALVLIVKEILKIKDEIAEKIEGVFDDDTEKITNLEVGKGKKLKKKNL